MEIYIDKLKIEMNRFNKLITNYEKIMLNLFNILNQTSSYWQDTNSMKFLDSVSRQKININKKINELKTLKDIYEYLIRKYETFGAKIEFDLSAKEKINTKMNKYIEKINKTIDDYNSLYLSFYPDERAPILNQKNELIKIGSKTEELKEKIRKSFIEIEEIEKTVNEKLSKINVEIIREETLK